MKTLWTMAGLAVSLTLGAETVLLDRTAPGGTSIDIALPERAVSDADRAVGEISLWITAGNATRAGRGRCLRAPTTST